jgi:Na+-translocating ferredoxin:NAD+ oxidoreductase RnfD subunit
MDSVGDALIWIGLGVSVLAIAGCLAALIVQVVTFAARRRLHQTAAVVFLRLSQVIVLGVLIAGLGLALRGQIPWWLLLISLVVPGVPALVLLRARIEFPNRP